MPTVPPLAVLVNQTVADYDTWKRAFDMNAPARKAASILGHHVNRDGNAVSIYLPATDRSKVAAFLSSPELKATMKDAGVTSAPQVVWLAPIEDAHIGNRETAAMVVTHEVADFAAWKKVYDSVESLRQKFGIIGAAVNCTLDTPNEVVVYHQAETREQLEAFVASDELKAAMKAGGVKGPPQIRYTQAVDGAAY